MSDTTDRDKLAGRGHRHLDPRGPVMRRIESRFYRTVSESRRERGMSSRVIECPFCGCYTEARLWSLAGTGKRCDCGATFDWLGTATLTRVAEQAEEDL